MTVQPAILAAVPIGLGGPLLAEYRQIVQNYMEHRWSPAELSGGKFCEIVYTILDGHAKGSYPASASKPSNFVSACRALESNAHVQSNAHVPRSFQILIPRLLPALYEIRNNRGVGHVGGDVDPNHMDANAVLSLASWTLAELVRVFHGLSADDAQKTVDSIAERRIPLVWIDGDRRRVLDTNLTIKHQILLLTATCPSSIQLVDLLRWTECKDKAYFKKLMRQLHKQRLLELSVDGLTAQILPPGANEVEGILAKRRAV